MTTQRLSPQRTDGARLVNRRESKNYLPLKHEGSQLNRSSSDRVGFPEWIKRPPYSVRNFDENGPG
ncbi:hypothetical protein T265_12229 [Opisthorchis viverrini]|uniref:Uncharacterized protein n=1 Tax=Opisthorchis viverrini TaxID=6198 RepID=A0A074YZC2_OPIVI|nr:hypothetical protein T265_12229 [Opisthorchis viverrini]KER18562.1 hypothetical protein T265_12229 [Opisthorchis viverrini]